MVVQVPIITDYQWSVHMTDDTNEMKSKMTLFFCSRKIYGSEKAIADSMICAGTQGKGPVHGDSGTTSG